MKVSVERRCVSVFFVVCMIAGTVSLMLAASPAMGVAYQQPFAYRNGEQAKESFARSMDLMDLNGDGISDLVVGAPYAQISTMKDAGSVRIYLSAGSVSLSKVVYINGTHAGDLFGFAVANAGDVNGDGCDDLAVGAPYADPEGAIDAGNVTLFQGWSGFDGRANVSINSASADERFGWALSAAGDVNGDGKADLIVGAPFNSSATLSEVGRTCVFYGGSPMNSVADINFTGEAAYGHFGWSVSGNANVDNDASMDMIVGAPDEISAGKALGAAHIYRNLDRSAGVQISTVRGAAANDKFGFCVKMVGDINGDTFDDIAIGAPFNDDNGTDAGEVTILQGGAKFDTRADLVLMGQAPNEWFGFSIASGDIHTDSYDDIIVGAPNSSTNATLAGRAYVFYGGTAPNAQADIILVPEVGSNFLGGSLAVGGNLTGSIAPDFAIGDPQYNLPGLPNAGKAYVYAGALVVIPKNPVVTGFVYSGTGVGLPGFTVTLEPLGKSATTTANGSYLITAVPGTYWLNVSKTGYVLNSTTVTLVMDQILRQDFVPDTVPIVRGVVTDIPSATVIRGATVAMYNGTTFVQSAITPANGTYRMSLPTAFIPAVGKETNLKMTAWDGTHYTKSMNVTVHRSDVKYANISLDKFPVITGVVQDAILSSAVRNARIVADQGGVVRGIATSDLRGNYELVAVNATVPAPLYLNVTAPGYWKDNAVVDVAKNGSYIQDFFLQSDTTPPTSSITTTLSSYTNTTVIALEATANDDNGIQEVQLWYRHGGTGYVLYGSDQTSPYSFVFNTTTTGGDGRYEFYTRAVDLAANVEAAPATNDTWTYVDTHPPVLTIIGPTEGQEIPTSTVSVAWTGSDAGSGILWYRVQLDSGAWIQKGTATSHSFTSVNDGSHRISVMASDKAQLLTTKLVNFTVNTTKSSSRVNALPTYEAEANFTVTVTAVPNPAGIKEVQLWYRFNSTGAFVFFGKDTTSPYAFQFNTSKLQGDGLYEFYSRAIDNDDFNESAPAGNDTWTIVDTMAPVVAITAPLDGHYYNTTNVPAAAYTVTELHAYTVVEKGYSTAKGEHTYTVTATDAAGNVGSASSTYTIDNTAPVVTISAPLADHYYKTADVPVAAYTVTELNPYTVVESGYSTVEGVHTYTVTATDAAGNVGGTASVTYTVDNTAPAVTITAPLDDHYYKTADVPAAAYTVTELNPYTVVEDGYSTAVGSHTYTVKATDEAGNVGTASATYGVDDTAPVVTISAPLADQLYKPADLPAAAYTVTELNPYTAVESGYSAAEGAHTYTVTATDGAGNVGTASVTYTVDGIAPVVTISAPLAGHFYKAADVPAGAFTATDANGVVSTTEGGWTNSPEGSHTYTVTATDAAGNVGTASVTYTVDNTAPVVTISAPLGGRYYKAANVPIGAFTATDANGVVSTTEDGWANSPEGPHTYTVTATDGAGNAGTASVTYTVDNTAPTVSITAPTANEKFKESTVTVSWTMVDSSSGIALAKISVDGGAFVSLGLAESYSVDNLDSGEHNVTIQVTDNAGNVKDVSVDFTVSTGGGISTLMIGGIALVIVVIIVAALLLMRGRKGPPAEKKEPEK